MKIDFDKEKLKALRDSVDKIKAVLTIPMYFKLYIPPSPTLSSQLSLDL
jgi:hypothetical protein